MEIKNSLCFYSRGSWGFRRFLRTQYAVCFLQYALSNKLGVIECLGFESLASTLNHELSTKISHLGSWLFSFFTTKSQRAPCFYDCVLRHYRDPSFVGMTIVSKRSAVIQNVAKRSEESFLGN